MKAPTEAQAVPQVAEALGQLLGAPPPTPEAEPEVDALFRWDGFTFVVEYKSSGSAGVVAQAAAQLQNYVAHYHAAAVPVVAVPYMGRVGRERCADAGVCWLDLCGNAHLVAPGLRVVIEGRPNRFKQRGRPSSAFAPKAARITRWLLIHYDRPMSQRELAHAVDVDEGYTSKVVSRLEKSGLVARHPSGSISPRDPDLLLDAWAEDYDFGKHEILQGHVAARSGSEALRKLTTSLAEQHIAFAATGLAAAWQMSHFATFRLVSLYLKQEPQPAMLEKIGFREESRGANVWLLVPNDSGVFDGAETHDEVPCVSTVQAYLDLLAHPERAEEAAAELRGRYLPWKNPHA